MKIRRELLSNLAMIMIDELRTEADEDAIIREHYSGRGMYGKDCVGFVISQGDVLSLGAAIGTAMERIDREDQDYEDGDLEVLQSMIQCGTLDSMGLSVIVYFPGVEIAE